MPQRAVGRASQEFVPIQEIRDGVVILKNGGLRLVLMVSSLNFALKSEDEQTAILLQFQNFLNSLDFSLQFFVQSRHLDIRPYLATLEEHFASQTNDLMKVQIREYIEFIKRFTESTEVMTKGFFVVIPYDPPILKARQAGLVGRLLPRGSAKGHATALGASDEEFDEYRVQLEQRAGVVEQGFHRSGLRVIQLGTEELIEFYFRLFNPGESEIPAPEEISLTT